MNQRARLGGLFGLGAWVLASGAFEACGGDNATNDAGPDATQSDVTTADALSDVTNTDAPPADAAAGCPSYSGSSELCQAIAARCGACGNKNITSCEVANFTTVCNTLATAYSQAYANAWTACESVCDAQATCMKTQLADAALSNAQQKAATDYCAKCGDGGSGCAATFESQLDVIYYSDSFMTAVDNACTPDASGACSGYLNCMTAVYKTTTASVCSDASTD